MALLAGWRHGAHDPTFGQANNGLRALAQLRAQLEPASVQADEVVHDGEPQSGTTLGGLVRQRALPERLHDAWDLLLGDAGPRVLDAEHLPALRRAPSRERDAPSARRELQGV